MEVHFCTNILVLPVIVLDVTNMTTIYLNYYTAQPVIQVE